MASVALTREEGWGLAISVAGHLGLLAFLLYRPTPGEVVIPPQRVEVTISEDVGLTSTSPDPAAQAASDRAPDLGEPAPEADAQEEPQPAPAAPPPPAPRAVAPPAPAPLPKPKPEPKKVEPKKPEPKKVEPKKVEPKKPEPKKAAPKKTEPKKAEPKKAEPKKAEPKKPAQPAKPKPVSPKTSTIDNVTRGSSSNKSAANSALAKSAPAKAATAPRKAGGSAFDEAFKSGSPGAQSQSGAGAPAAAIGPRQVSALNAAIGRQLKPHWRGKAPEGADAELLVTRIRFRLNRDGGLAGEPQVLSTTGQTEANAAQVTRHQEQAVRAVKLAAPFDLPADLYDGWKVVTTNFDRKLSQ